MDYRRLGQSDFMVSPLCLGTMTFGSSCDEATAREIVGRARASGVNFIDTADQYGDGLSEEIVGRAIRETRKDWVLATKVGNPLGGVAGSGGLSRRWMTQAVEASLKRLGTDWIDLYTCIWKTRTRL